MAELEKAEGKKKKILRREFLISSGTALAAGALAVCASDTEGLEQVQASRLTIDRLRLRS